MRVTVKEDQVAEWRKAQEEDEEIGFLLRKKLEGSKPTWREVSALPATSKYLWKSWDSLELRQHLLVRRWESADGTEESPLIVVPKTKIPEVLEACHEAPTGGHFGVRKTLAKVRQRFFWLDHRADVEEWCRRCHACTARKGPQEKGRGLLRLYNVGAPFERVALDIVGPLPKTSSGNRYALVVVDYFSKWPEIIPIPDQRAKTVATALLKDVICRHGIPLELHSDQGRSFESAVFQELMRLLGIKKTRTTPLHPQSDGLVERMIRTLLQYLSMYVAENQKDWDQWIPLFLLAYRSSRHESTQKTPSLILTGRELRLPLDLLRGPSPCTQNEDTFVGETKRRLEEIHKFVRRKMRLCSERMKSWYDTHSRPLSFVPGEQVWLYAPKRTKGRCPKLQKHWEGPYRVQDRLNELIYRVVRSPTAKPKVVHVNRLARFRSKGRKPDEIKN